MSGKEAVLAVTKNLVDLNSALSEQWNTLNIVNKCQEKHLITSGVSSALLDSQTNKSTQDRASQLVSNLQTAIRLQPECLDTFLCILKDEGGVSCSTVAQNIAKECKLFCHNFSNKFGIHHSQMGYKNCLNIIQVL